MTAVEVPQEVAARTPQEAAAYRLRWESWSSADLFNRATIEGWQDPFDPTPVWSAAHFSHVVADLAGDELRYLVALSDGQPVLAAPVLCYQQPGGLLFYDPVAMVGDDRAFGEGPVPCLNDAVRREELERARASLYPTLAVGTYGSHSGVLVDPALTVGFRSASCRRLVGATAALARQRGCRSYGLLYLSSSMLRHLRPVPADLQLALLGAEARILTEAPDLATYVATLSRRRRQRIEHERRSAARGGLNCTVEVGADAIDEDLVTLRCALRSRYGLPDQREETEREFDSLRRWCAERLVVSRSRRAGATVGFTIFIREGNRMAARTAGFDEQRLDRQDFAYFNTTYYAPLEWGLPRGLRSFDFGLASYPAKRTRGCSFEPRFGLFSLAGESLLQTALVEQDSLERARLRRECGSALTEPLNPAPAGQGDGR